MADIASRDSTRLHTLAFFKGKIVVEEGGIISVKANGVIVLVPRYGIEGKIYLCDSTDTSLFWNLDRQHQAIVSSDGKVTLQVFGRVKVEISLDETRVHAPKVVFKCLDPPLHLASGEPYRREEAGGDEMEVQQQKRRRDVRDVGMSGPNKKARQ